jgi:hypothetical protein
MSYLPRRKSLEVFIRIESLKAKSEEQTVFLISELFSFYYQTQNRQKVKIKIERLKFSKFQAGSDVSVQLAS